MPTPQSSYELDDAGRFTVTHYNWSKPFSNFLPGIAGKWGIPLWLFYVNRGQAVCSLGVHDKDHAILEFLSFNKALQVVGQQGFRSFIRLDGGPVYEPFHKLEDDSIEQTLTVTSHEIGIREHHPGLDLQITVSYFPLTNLPLAGLVRRVTIANMSAAVRELELIDGLPKILPYGVTFEHVKVIARHIEGMMGAFEVAGVPLYRLKQTPGDVEQVGQITGGNFYLSVDERGEMLGEQTLVDPFVVFGEQEAHEYPWQFAHEPLEELLRAEQVRENRTPSALVALRRTLPAGDSLTLHSIVGFAPTDAALAEFAERAADLDFFDRQRTENERVIEQLKQTALTISGQPTFDQYVQQTFLDNVMRGGMPLTFESDSKKTVFYIYARQNGDLERDYHWFVLEPTYLSQGNGHYRSILQNRRMDGWFFPEIEDFNLTTYLNLIQTDGYNPLVVNGFSYTAEDDRAVDKWIRQNLPRGAREPIGQLVRGSFTPGEFVGALEELGEPVERTYEELLAELLALCSVNEIGGLHEGFWQDHWTYNLDTIDTFRMIYPECWRRTLLERRAYTYFDDPDVVQPRQLKTVLVGRRVRQYGAVVRDPEKEQLIATRERDAYKVRTEHGQGAVYRSNLLVKLLCIISNRIASLDREGIGVEMEAGKPGWLDSLNGLPALFGSSLNETLEIERACRLLIESLSSVEVQPQPVFRELAEFIRGLDAALRERLAAGKPLAFWTHSHDLLEAYRAATRLGIAGEEIELSREEITGFLENCLAVISDGLSDDNTRDESGLPHTYFITDIVKYELAKADVSNADGGELPVKPLEYKHRPMAPYLEGPVHTLRARPEEAASTYAAVRRSELFDRPLEMFRCCGWQKDEPMEIGRIKSYARGWIENESIYTHMEYKWLLEVLRSGLHDEFFEDIRAALVPFMDPAVYGRSLMENCSFIASSVYPDARSHGRAFQPRLSGVTCEMLHIWTVMVAGPQPFFLNEIGDLTLRLHPILHERFFTTAPVTRTYWDAWGEPQTIRLPENSFGFKFLGKTMVVYLNPQRRPTYGESGVGPVEYTLTYRDGPTITEDESTLWKDLAKHVRRGAVSRLDVMLG